LKPAESVKVCEDWYKRCRMFVKGDKNGLGINIFDYSAMIQDQPTETRIASVHRDENGVIVITMKDCGLVDQYDIMDLNLVIRHKANQQNCLKLVIATGDWDMNKEAREMALNEDHLSRTKARAIVVSSKLKASLFNFLKQFNNKEYPLQFFENKETAYHWLLTFREDINKHAQH
jgi:hypothetical protein